MTGRGAQPLRRSAPGRLLASPGWLLLVTASIALLSAALVAPVLFARAAESAALDTGLAAVEQDAFTGASANLRATWDAVLPPASERCRPPAAGSAAGLRTAGRHRHRRRGGSRHHAVRRRRRGRPAVRAVLPRRRGRERSVAPPAAAASGSRPSRRRTRRAGGRPGPGRAEGGQLRRHRGPPPWWPARSTAPTARRCLSSWPRTRDLGEGPGLGPGPSRRGAAVDDRRPGHLRRAGAQDPPAAAVDRRPGPARRRHPPAGPEGRRGAAAARPARVRRHDPARRGDQHGQAPRDPAVGHVRPPRHRHRCARHGATVRDQVAAFAGAGVVLAVVVVCAAAVLLGRSRRHEQDLLSGLGMRPREIAALTALELLGPAVVGAVAGAGGRGAAGRHARTSGSAHRLAAGGRPAHRARRAARDRARRRLRRGRGVEHRPPGHLVAARRGPATGAVGGHAAGRDRGDHGGGAQHRRGPAPGQPARRGVPAARRGVGRAARAARPRAGRRTPVGARPGRVAALAGRSAGPDHRRRRRGDHPVPGRRASRCWATPWRCTGASPRASTTRSPPRSAPGRSSSWATSWPGPRTAGRSRRSARSHGGTVVYRGQARLPPAFGNQAVLAVDSRTFADAADWGASGVLSPRPRRARGPAGPPGTPCR